MRIGISARLAKTAAAALGDKDPHDIELMWPGLTPPYLDLFAWLEGRAEKPVNRDPDAVPPGDAGACDRGCGFRQSRSRPTSSPNGNGTASACRRSPAATSAATSQARLYSRTGEDITKSFPDLVPSLHLPGAIDGELLVLRDGRVQTFNVLQQRLNRKVVSPKLIKDFPIHLRAYDLLGDDDERSARTAVRRAPRAARGLRQKARRSPHRSVADGRLRQLGRADRGARRSGPSAGAGEDADAVEGVMLKRRDAAYLPGRPKGQWWKWKRDPHIIDAVLMYAQRGHGKRSSYYSDYTFGVWTSGEDGEQLVPVGKAYFGFTDEELLQIDRFVRRNTTEKFGPVRHVVHEPDQGLVLEVAFEGLARSPRHKSGVAMRFPRISRLRWDKPPREADRLETLERMLKSDPALPRRNRQPLTCDAGSPCATAVLESVVRRVSSREPVSTSLENATMRA